MKLSRPVLNSLQCLLIVFVTISCPGITPAQTFSDRTNLLSTSDINSGVAMGIVDMDGDGKDDLIRLDQTSDLRIEYQQAPDAAFSTLVVGSITSRSWAVAIGDVDNNGFNDILAGGAYNGISLLKANTTGTGYSQSMLSNSDIFLQGCNLVDINNDGWLDFFGCHDDDDSHKYRNDRSGNLIYDSSLMDTLMPSGNAGNYASLWTDYDNDGDLDMYLSKCRQGSSDPTDPRRINRLFENNGFNSFSDAGPGAGLDSGRQTWATEFADIDNDGDLDVFMLNHFESCMLLINDGNGTFTDITATSGLTMDDLNFFGIQTVMQDFDNDGFVDILCSGDEQRFFHNNGNTTFSRINGILPANEMESCCVGDLNSDGYLDVYGGFANIFNSPSNIDDVLLFNDGGSNNFFTVLLTGVDSNANGVGARLELHGGWGIQIREVRAGESYGIVNSFRSHFGIGTAAEIDRLVVRWPSGVVDVIYDPAINTNMTLIEGSSLPLVTSADSFEVLRGEYSAGDVSDLVDSDNADLSIQRNPIDLTARTSIRVEAVSPIVVPTRFDFTLEASVFARSVVQQKIQLFNFNTGAFEEVDFQNASRFVDRVVVATPSGDLSRFVEPGTGAIEARIDFTSVSPRQNFSANIDMIRWEIE